MVPPTPVRSEIRAMEPRRDGDGARGLIHRDSQTPCGMTAPGDRNGKAGD